MQNQIELLLKEVALAGTLLPILLMVIPRGLSEDMKKGITFLMCVVLTTLIAQGNPNFKLDLGGETADKVGSWIAHLVVILTVASITYDKVWKPAANTLARKAGLKFLHRGSKN